MRQAREGTKEDEEEEERVGSDGSGGLFFVRMISHGIKQARKRGLECWLTSTYNIVGANPRLHMIMICTEKSPGPKMSTEV